MLSFLFVVSTIIIPCKHNAMQLTVCHVCQNRCLQAKNSEKKFKKSLRCQCDRSAMYGMLFVAGCQCGRWCMCGCANVTGGRAIGESASLTLTLCLPHINSKQLGMWQLVTGWCLRGWCLRHTNNAQHLSATPLLRSFNAQRALFTSGRHSNNPKCTNFYLDSQQPFNYLALNTDSLTCRTTLNLQTRSLT